MTLEELDNTQESVCLSDAVSVDGKFFKELCRLARERLEQAERIERLERDVRDYKESEEAWEREHEALLARVRELEDQLFDETHSDPSALKGGQ